MIDNWRTQKVEQFLFALDGLLFADIVLSFCGEPAAIERKSINKSGLCIGTDVWFIDYYLYCDSLNYITLLCQVYYRCVCPWIDRTMETESESIYMPRCCGLEPCCPSNRLALCSGGATSEKVEEMTETNTTNTQTLTVGFRFYKSFDFVSKLEHQLVGEINGKLIGRNGTVGLNYERISTYIAEDYYYTFTVYWHVSRIGFNLKWFNLKSIKRLLIPTSDGGIFDFNGFSQRQLK